MNKVRLTHAPTGISVACQEQRDLTTNRSVYQSKCNIYMNMFIDIHTNWLLNYMYIYTYL